MEQSSDNARLLKENAEKDAQIKALVAGLRAISTTVGIDRTLHLTSCVRYGGRVFDPHSSACTAECAAVRPALDALASLP